MKHDSAEIIRSQREIWNKFSSAWKKWDHISMNGVKDVNDEIISRLNLRRSDLILDIASGTGEPGITIAEMVPQGKVIATDLSEKMLEVAAEKALSRSINNFETRIADSETLPFPDNHFDAVTCRFGFMFFPDMKKTLTEMIRVTKHGGKVVASVWDAPEKNFWTGAIFSVLKNHVELPPPPPPDQPGMFRCSAENFMTELFDDCGLSNITESAVSAKFDFGTAEDYWNLQTEMSVPVVLAFEKTDAAVIEKIKTGLFKLLDEKFPDGKVKPDYSAIVISGMKP